MYCRASSSAAVAAAEMEEMDMVQTETRAELQGKLEVQPDPFWVAAVGLDMAVVEAAVAAVGLALSGKKLAQVEMEEVVAI